MTEFNELPQTGTTESSTGAVTPNNLNTGVAAATTIPSQATAGPYPGDFSFGRTTSDDNRIDYFIEVKCKNGMIILETESSNHWLRYIQPARDRHEQNCEFHRKQNDQIFLYTIRSLEAGDQLIAWFSDHLAREIGIPFLGLHNILGNQRYVCDNCGKSYTHPNPLKAHLRFRCPKQQKLSKHINKMLDRTDVERKLFAPYNQCGCLSAHARLPASTDLRIKKIPDFPVYNYHHNIDMITRNKLSPSSAFQPIDRYNNNHPYVGLKLGQREPTDMFLDGLASKPKDSTARDSPLKATKCTSKLTSVNENFISQPIQIFNHIQPHIFPFPVTALTSQYRCYDVWNPFSLFPPAEKGQFDSTWDRKPLSRSQDRTVQCKASTASEERSATNLTLTIPLPSESDGEPLDLLPKSYFANKSKKGHLCVYCGKLYSRKYGLKIHLRTHTGYKPLKCKVCLRPFGDPSNLNKHIRLHAEGDTPYRCDFCGKVLVRRRDLERHLKSRHPNEILVKSVNIDNEKQKETKPDAKDIDLDDMEQEVIVV